MRYEKRDFMMKRNQLKLVAEKDFINALIELKDATIKNAADCGFKPSYVWSWTLEQLQMETLYDEQGEIIDDDFEPDDDLEDGEEDSSDEEDEETEEEDTSSEGTKGGNASGSK